MSLTCKDILEHQEALNTYCMDEGGYNDMIARFAHTFEPDINLCLDVLREARDLLENISDGWEYNYDNE